MFTDRKFLRGCKVFAVLPLATALGLVCFLPVLAYGGTISTSLGVPPYEIKEDASGRTFITWTGELAYQRGSSGGAGCPDLPTIMSSYVLPPNVDADSITVRVTNVRWEAVAGAYSVAPVPVPAADTGEGLAYMVGKDKRLVDGRDVEAYSANAYGPTEPVVVRSVSQTRKWKTVDVEFSPFQYNPVTGALQVAMDVRVRIDFGVHALTGAERRLLKDAVLDERILKGVRNRSSASAWYRADGKGAPPAPGGAAVPDAAAAEALEGGYAPAGGAHADYVIITTQAVRSGSGTLSAFVTTKQNQGLDVLVVDETTWGGGTGDAAAENLRAWLAGNYASMGIKYVLLIGNPHPSTGDVPMKKCWPCRGGGSYQDSPTDYYYADLTGNWDLNGNGYYGEYRGDVGVGGIDLSPEVIVGRIPFSGNWVELDTILAKLISYETATGDVSWRTKGLLAAAVSNYSNEDRSGWARTDGGDWGDYCKSDIFDAAGAPSTRQYEKEGLSPVSRFCERPLTRANLLDEWNKGYGFISWWAHGSRSLATRKVWVTDDGDNVPEGAEIAWPYYIAYVDGSSIAADAAAIVTQCSCLNGYPEDPSNLQYKLLCRGAIGTVGASRVSWYAIGSWRPSYGTSYGDNASYGYYIPKKMVLEEMSLGEANHWCRQNFGRGWGDASYMNVFDFNIYGDPSLVIAAPDSVPLSIATSDLADGRVGVSYSQTLLATGGDTPYSWSVAGGSLPLGVSVDSSTGVISGTPVSAGTYDFTVRVSDSQTPPAVDDQLLSVAIPAPLVIVTTSLADGQINTAYSQTLDANFGKAPYSWSVTSGALPAGLSLNASTGEIAGTPTIAGTCGFTVKVEDSQTPKASDMQSLSIAVKYPPLGLLTTSLPNGQVNTAYSQTLLATGGKTPYSWSVASGALPVGLSLNALTGVMSGTPTTGGTWGFTVRVSDNQTPAAADEGALSVTIEGPAVSITAIDPYASEDGANYGRFEVSRTGSKTSNLYVYYTIAGTASSGEDYYAISTRVTIPAGSQEASFYIRGKVDAFVEGDETVQVALAADGAYSIDPARSGATVTIHEEPLVWAAALDPDASEDGVHTGKIAVYRTGPGKNLPLIVNLSTAGSTAANGSDYVSIATKVTIPANYSSSMITIKGVPDGIADNDETVVLAALPGGGYEVDASYGPATVTIHEEPLVWITAADAHASEDGTNFGKFAVYRSGDKSAPLTVYYNTALSTAAGGADYAPIEDHINIPANSSYATVTIIGKPDAIVEGDETVVLALNADAAYQVDGYYKSAKVTLHEDQLVWIRATDPDASEDGKNTGEFTVYRTGDKTAPLTVYYSISGYATNDVDYVAIPSRVTMAPLQASATIIITGKPDAVSDRHEYATLALSANAAYHIDTSSSFAFVTIHEDNLVSIAATDDYASESGTDRGLFTLSRAGLTAAGLTVYLDTAGGAAGNGSDYQSISTSPVIPVNADALQIWIVGIPDGVPEGDEAAALSIKSSGLYCIDRAHTKGVVTIHEH